MQGQIQSMQGLGGHGGLGGQGGLGQGGLGGQGGIGQGGSVRQYSAGQQPPLPPTPDQRARAPSPPSVMRSRSRIPEGPTRQGPVRRIRSTGPAGEDGGGRGRGAGRSLTQGRR